MLSFLSDDVRRNPYPAYAQLRATSPLLHLPERRLWMLFDYDGVRRALTDHDTFSSRASVSGGQPLDWLIFLDPTRHTKLRAIVAKAFTPRVVADLEPRIRELVGGLLDRALGGDRMDVAVDFAIPLPLMVIAEMIGIPLDDRPRFARWSDVILGLSDTIALGSDAAASAAAAFRGATAEMRTYVAGLAAERRAMPKDDLLTRLVDAEVDGEHLSEDELVGFFQLLLVAGSETTTNLIGNAILAFVEHPAELARVRAEPALLPGAIEEILRYRTPVQAMFRQTRRDVVLHGTTIPAGELVLAMIGAANRDPAVFPEPDRLDATREPNPHVAFGHGIHYCLGAPLARLEGRVALAVFLDRVARFEIVSEAPWEPRKAFHVHGPSRLPIRIGG